MAVAVALLVYYRHRRQVLYHALESPTLVCCCCLLWVAVCSLGRLPQPLEAVKVQRQGTAMDDDPLAVDDESLFEAIASRKSQAMEAFLLN